MSTATDGPTWQQGHPVTAPTDIRDGRILVLDDQPSNVLLLERILRVAGYRQVQGTSDPQAACVICREWPVDLLLLDLQMPVMDGFQVMQTLGAATAPTAPTVLALTAEEDPRTRQAALAAGAAELLLKPYDRAELLRQISHLLASRPSSRATAG